jgi:fumarate hydratase class II
VKSVKNLMPRARRHTPRTRIERDSLGEVRVPADTLYGAQTQRVLDNFRISALRMPRPFLRALGLIKCAAGRSPARFPCSLLTPRLTE